MKNDTWLDDFLPVLRCPETQQPLRRATSAECAKLGLKEALVTLDGERAFVVDAGIPILLPKTA